MVELVGALAGENCCTVTAEEARRSIPRMLPTAS
jgi:hypothetical protein